MAERAPDHHGSAGAQAWAGGQRGRSPVAGQAELIRERDGEPDELVERLRSVTGVRRVNLAARGQRGADPLPLLEAFRWALEGASLG